MSPFNETLNEWREATAALPWGVQGLCHDALTLAANEKITLVHGADYKDGRPCLFNAIRQMTTQLSESPSSYAGEVVRAFDSINHHLWKQNVNTKMNVVSPLAAEILLRNFGSLKAAPTADDIKRMEIERESFMRNCTPYIEPTDEEVMTQWLLAIEGKDTSDAATDRVHH
jgi:hypothetical protein